MSVLQKKLISINEGNTSNMRRQLKGKHPTVLLPDRQEAAAAAETTSEAARTSASASTDPGVLTNTAAVAAAPQQVRQPREFSMQIFVRRPIQPLQQSKVDEALVKMIAMHFQPFSTVVNGGFRTYTQALEPTYSMSYPAPTVTKRMLPNLYDKVRAELKERIKTVPAVSQLTAGHQTPPPGTCL